MEWIALYRDVLGYAKHSIAKNAVFAYNVNIDLVKHLTSEKPPEKISKILSGCVREGKQREVQVDRRTINLLIEKLGYDEIRMGGQAGNMANTASALGVLSYVHVLSKSREQMKLFENPRNILIAHNGFKNPDEVSVVCDAPVHSVLEFKKGFKLGELVAPSPNRLILSWNPPDSVLKIDEEFAKNIKQILPQVNHAFVSGFHNLTLKEEFTRKIKNNAMEIEEWKEINGKLKIHVELGNFQSLRILREVALRVLPLSDSVGFDEYELKQLKQTLHVEGSLWKACDRLCSAFNSVVFHSPAFSFSLDTKPNQEGLLFGSLVAAYKAATGKNPSFSQLERFEFNLNRDGVRKYNEFKKVNFKNSASFTPALHVSEPKITVGLGDCFATGYFLLK